MSLRVEKFSSFAELARFARPGKDFLIERREGTTGLAIMAPHGGRIEWGTDTVADAIAGSEHAYYAFKGIRSRNNWQLHVPSTSFEEPCALEMIQSCHTVMTIHGCRRTGKSIYIGGRDADLKAIVVEKLNLSGFDAENATATAIMGVHPNNLCNRGSRGQGLQLEISRPLRRSMVGRDGLPTPKLTAFVQAVRQGLNDSLPAKV